MDLSALGWAVPLGLVVGFVALRRFSQIGSAAARKLVEGGAKLVDVRTPAEFGAAHIPGSINVPVGDLPARAAGLGARDAPIVVYCASGARSLLARGILKRAGFTQVHDLGPMSRW